MKEKEIPQLIERQKVYAKLVKIDELLNEARSLAWEVKTSFHENSLASMYGRDIYEKLRDVTDESDNAVCKAFSIKTFCEKR